MGRVAIGGAGGRWALAAASLAVVLAACGASVQPEVQSATPLTAPSVAVQQSGNAQAQLVTSTATYQIDDSGALVIKASVLSTASVPQTIASRATLYEASGAIIGDASGGAVSVAPGATAAIELTGPPPHGVIAAAVFEISSAASPTPVVSTPIPSGTFAP